MFLDTSIAAIDTGRQAALLAWYGSHHRRLPWRAGPGEPRTHPYAVVVSELMLQQTRVDTVRDYFARWMQRWPGWADLAAASEDEVLAQWTGLGYYTRARNLHATARAVVARHGGQLPGDPAALQDLPGLGPYTVGAVRSLAFGQAAALVDGNVARVLSRWFGLTDDPMQGRGKTAVWQRAQHELTGPGPATADPSSWNQALMELGATLCAPRQPNCAACPVALGCAAQRQGLQAAIPPPRKRAEVREVTADYTLLLRPAGSGVAQPDADLVLLGQRPRRGLWAGLWEPPGAVGAEAHERLAQTLAPCKGPALGALQPWVHVLTHRRYRVQAAAWQGARADIDLGAVGYIATKWIPISQALSHTSGLSRLGQKVIESWLVRASGHPVSTAPQ